MSERGFSEGLRGTDGIRGRGVSVALRPSTRASKLPVTQLVFVARGAFPRSTPCVCALRGFLPGRVLPDRTTRRHGLARPPLSWVGWAERVATHMIPSLFIVLRTLLSYCKHSATAIFWRSAILYAQPNHCRLTIPGGDDCQKTSKRLIEVLCGTTEI